MDNEYTPTTEDVEHYYGLAREEWNYGEELTGEQSRAEFYRWLAAHDEQVRAEVAERIVTPEARKHWDWAERRRDRFGDIGCVCALCGVMSRIAREKGSYDDR